jgi:hypothetical protein
MMTTDMELRSIQTTDTVKRNRSALCEACPENKMNVVPTCDKCACPIEYVVNYNFKMCPIGRWTE